MITTMTPIDILTATAQEIALHVEKVSRAENWNHIEKLIRRNDLAFALRDDGSLQYAVRMKKHGYANESNRLPAEQLPAHRRYWQAELDWIEANPGDDMTAEHIAQTVRFAKSDLNHAGELRSAMQWAAEVDEWSEHYNREEPRPDKTLTHEKLTKKFRDAADTIRDRMVSILTREDSAFLCEITNRSWRTKERFFVNLATIRDQFGGQLHPFRLTDITLSARYCARHALPNSPAAAAGGFVPGGYWSANFEKCVGNARTLAEVKRLCSIWHEPIKAMKVAGMSIVLSQERSAEGAHWLMVAPIEAKQSAAAHDATQSARWGKTA